MAWGTTNVTQDGSGYVSQTSIAAVGLLNLTIDADEYPCLYCNEIDFAGPYNTPGGTFTSMVRYLDASNNLKAKITNEGGGFYGFTVSRVETSASNPNTPTTPWAVGNGDVNAIVQDSNGDWYVAGNATFDDDTAAPVPDSEYLVKISGATGEVDQTWVATPNGAVLDLYLDEDNGILYAGGAFSTIDTAGNHGGPITAQGAVGLSTTDGSYVLRLTSGILSGQINAVHKVTEGDTEYLYIGGTFPGFVGSPTLNVMKYGARLIVNHGASPGLGTLQVDTSWQPKPQSFIYDIESDDDYIYYGGAFTSWDDGGLVQNALVRVDRDDPNSVDSWDVDINGGSGGQVRAFYHDAENDLMYIGGFFTSAGGVTRNAVFAVSTSTGALTSWNPSVTSGGSPIVHSIAPNTELDTLYLGGDYSTVGVSGRDNIAEVDTDFGAVTDWNPGADDVVLAVGYSESGHSILIGGEFANAGFTARDRLARFTAPVPDDFVLVDLTGQPMPEDNKFALVLCLTCGEMLCATLQEHTTGRILHYTENVVDWIDDTEVRVELGPAGVQGPRINNMVLRSKDGCNQPASGSTYTACTDNEEAIAEAYSSSSSADIAIGGTPASGLIRPGSWSTGIADLGYPNNGQARGWVELWDLTGDITVTGASETYQFSNIFCFDIQGITGYTAGLNADDDNIKRRDITALIGGTATTDNDGYTVINGLAVRLDFRSSTFKIGKVINERVKAGGWLAGFNAPKMIVRPGTFESFTGGTLLLSNLDQFDTQTLTIEIGYVCSDTLSVTVWADAGGDDIVVVAAMVSVDQTVIPASELGLYFGAYAIGIAKNGYVVNDDDIFNIGCTQILHYYDTDTPCS